jgi:uncharacterized membrane protein
VQKIDENIVEWRRINLPFLSLCHKITKVRKEHKFTETTLRSLLKTMGFRAIEILIDTAILMTINSNFQENLVISICIELICWMLSFIWERLWNRTDFGRKAKCPHCDKEI